MRLQDLNWMDVERYLQQDNRIILITGATEQHAYLSLATDILIPQKIADVVAQHEGILIAPPLNFGVSELFLDFPGTVSISQAVFNQVLDGVISSLQRQGFKKFLVLNGHGGNQCPPRVQDLGNDAIWYSWFEGEAARSFEAMHNMRINHANWGENFPFNRVAEAPEGTKPSVQLRDISEENPARAVLDDGSFGGAYQVDDTLMQQLFEVVTEEAVTLAKRLST